MCSVNYEMYVYTTKSCLYCMNLKKRLRDLGFKYTELDVQSNLDTFKKIMDRTSTDEVPVVLVNNQILVPRLSFNDIDTLVSLIIKIIEGDSGRKKTEMDNV